MKSRLAITAALVAGLLTSLSGAALGISGIAASGSASTAEYSQPQQAVQGVQTPSGTQTGTTPSVAPTLGPTHSTAPAAQVNAPAQTSSSPVREIPFTGFLAIPVLLIGVALLATGAVLRRRTLPRA